VARLDLTSRRIQRFDRVAPVDDPRRNTISAIRGDGQGGLWLGTGAGIEHFDPQAGERREVLRLSDAPRSNRAGMPRSSAFQVEATCMLGAAAGGGRLRIARRSRAYLRSGGAAPAYGTYRDAAGRLWVGRLDGFWRIGDSGRIEPVVDSTGRPV